MNLVKTFGRNIRYHSHTYICLALFPGTSAAYNAHNNGCVSLLCAPAPSDLCSNSTKIGFINFNRTIQLVPSGLNHPTAQFVKPLPCSIVAPKTKNSLQPKCAGSMLLTGNEPHGEKPSAKWFVSLVKQCSCRNRSLTFALSAQKKASLNQRWIFRCYPAGRALETLGHRSLEIYWRQFSSLLNQSCLSNSLETFQALFSQPPHMAEAFLKKWYFVGYP